MKNPLKHRSFSFGRLSPRRGGGDASDPVSPKKSSDKSTTGELRSPKQGSDTRKLKLIGRSVSGTEVWLVKRTDGWSCCAKIIRYSSSSLKDVENFERELEILRNLPEKTKHVVQYLGYVKTDEEIQLYDTKLCSYFLVFIFSILGSCLYMMETFIN
jgi:hypothetical protein